MRHYPINTAIGDRMLCAWQPVRGVVWVQTRDPKFAANLKRRSDSRLVVWSVHGGYLMTLEFVKKSMAWADRLIKRYQAGQIELTHPNDALADANPPIQAAKWPGGTKGPSGQVGT